MKKLESLDKKADGTLLNAFGTMLSQKIDQSNGTPEQKKKAEAGKKDALRQASNILNDSSLNTEGRMSALHKLFGTFEENKEFFPTNQTDTQAQQTEQERRQDFFDTLTKTSLDVQVQNVSNAHNNMKAQREKFPPDGQPPGSPEKIRQAEAPLRDLSMV